MMLEEFRRSMAAYRYSVDDEARRLKDSYSALDKLYAMYKALDGDERRMADQVLSEWALSDDEGIRFDALALIDDFQITQATSSLRALADRLSVSSSPGSPYELQKVRRILKKLSGDA